MNKYTDLYEKGYLKSQRVYKRPAHLLYAAGFFGACALVVLWFWVNAL